MISRIHNKLGTAGFVVAIVALVAALSGVAIAAGGALTSKQKKEVKKIAKSVAKPGPAGPQGPQGLPGAPGAKGDTGAAGANGTDGEDGTDGTDGKGVIVGTPTVGECPAGGATVQKEGEPASKKAICNGEDGEDGEDGETVYGGILPYEKSVTGAWSLGKTSKTNQSYRVSVSYGFKLPEGKKATPKFVKTAGEEAANCPGSFEDPQAAPGFLCYYVGLSSPPVSEWAEKAPTAKFNAAASSLASTNYVSGNTFKFESGNFTCFTEGNCPEMELSGTWAVTAPAAPAP